MTSPTSSTAFRRFSPEYDSHGRCRRDLHAHGANWSASAKKADGGASFVSRPRYAGVVSTKQTEFAVSVPEQATPSGESRSQANISDAGAPNRAMQLLVAVIGGACT